MQVSSFRDFWDLVVEVWQQGVFGIQIADTLVALVIFGRSCSFGTCSPASC
jgi:MscS family membrane protein